MFTYCNNSPTNSIDYSGTIPEVIEEIIEVGSEGGYVITPLGLLRYTKEYNAKGALSEHWIDKNNKKRWSRHHSNHGNAKEHPDVPHDHKWDDDDKGNNTPGPPMPPNSGFHAPTNGDAEKNNDTAQKMLNATACVGTAYVVYLGVKWIIAVCAAPATGGGSLIVAGATP